MGRSSRKLFAARGVRRKQETTEKLRYPVVGGGREREFAESGRTSVAIKWEGPQGWITIALEAPWNAPLSGNIYGISSDPSLDPPRRWRTH